MEIKISSEIGHVTHRFNVNQAQHIEKYYFTPKIFIPLLQFKKDSYFISNRSKVIIFAVNMIYSLSNIKKTTHMLNHPVYVLLCNLKFHAR